MLGLWLATCGKMCHLLCWGAAREEQVERVRELKDSALDKVGECPYGWAEVTLTVFQVCFWGHPWTAPS